MSRATCELLATRALLAQVEDDLDSAGERLSALVAEGAAHGEPMRDLREVHAVVTRTLAAVRGARQPGARATSGGRP